MPPLVLPEITLPSVASPIPSPLTPMTFPVPAVSIFTPYHCYQSHCAGGICTDVVSKDRLSSDPLPVKAHIVCVTADGVARVGCTTADRSRGNIHQRDAIHLVTNILSTCGIVPMKLPLIVLQWRSRIISIWIDDGDTTRTDTDATGIATEIAISRNHIASCASETPSSVLPMRLSRLVTMICHRSDWAVRLRLSHRHR